MGRRERVRYNKDDSDDSDEDYVLSDEENQVSGGNALDGDISEGFFGSFVDDEDQEEEKEAKKVVESRVKRDSLACPKNESYITYRKRKRISYEEEEVGDNDDHHDDDGDYTYSDEDEQFETCFDEEEESNAKRKKTCSLKRGNLGFRKKSSAGTKKKRKKYMFLHKNLPEKGRNNLKVTRRARIGENGVQNKKKKKTNKNKNSRGRKRKINVSSDSDFVCSRSLEYKYYTISEEEREQIREAGELCASLSTNLRSPLSTKVRKEIGGVVHPHRNRLGRKGKEKVEEVTKQVCGICLSTEDKRKARGILDCCSHYFCFTCIMEWSKVESRCPLCKQRFKLITKPAKSTALDLRNVVIQVPERDQVYEPSHEELLRYLDPYESVFCIECNEGGDDGLMLLCDLCDSSAHTYCVGLGHQVPEGNWYCRGCRPVVVGSSPSQDESLDRTGISPYTTPTQGIWNIYSPRFPAREDAETLPASGAGVSTLSGRRIVLRRIQNLRSLNRSRTDSISTASMVTDFLNAERNYDRELASGSEFIESRFRSNPSAESQTMDLFSSGLSELRMKTMQEPTTTTVDDGSVNLTLWHELEVVNSILSNEQLGFDYKAKEEVYSMVGSHLKNLRRDADTGSERFKEVVRSCSHTILAACGLEKWTADICMVRVPSDCTHLDRVADGETSLVRKDICSSCFDSFAKDVVQSMAHTMLPQQWLSLGH